MAKEKIIGDASNDVTIVSTELVVIDGVEKILVKNSDESSYSFAI